jgi:hypothetical protein
LMLWVRGLPESPVQKKNFQASQHSKVALFQFLQVFKRQSISALISSKSCTAKASELGT